MVKLDAQLVDAARVLLELRRLNHIVFGPLDVELQQIDPLTGEHLEHLTNRDELHRYALASEMTLARHRPGYVSRIVGQKELRRSGCCPQSQLEQSQMIVPKPLD